MKKSLSKLFLSLALITSVTACSGNNAISNLDPQIVEASSVKTDLNIKKENKVNSGNPSEFSKEEQLRRMNKFLQDFKTKLTVAPDYNDMLKTARQALNDAAGNSNQTVNYRFEKVYKPAIAKLLEQDPDKKTMFFKSALDVIGSDATSGVITSVDDTAAVVFSLLQTIINYKPISYNDVLTMISYADSLNTYCKDFENKFYSRKAVILNLVKSKNALAPQDKELVFKYMADIANINTWKESNDKLSELYVQLKTTYSQNQKK